MCRAVGLMKTAVRKKCKHNRRASKQNNKSKVECSPKVSAIGNRNSINKKVDDRTETEALLIALVPLVRRGLRMCLSLQISEYSQTPPRPQTKAPVCVFVEENKWLLCACAHVPACWRVARTLALKSERFAGVARRAWRLFEIIRQLPALPGFRSSLSSSFSSSYALLCQD